MEVLWQDYLGSDNVHIVNASTYDESWSSINGDGWRTYFNPPLTYWLSTSTELFTHYFDFGGGVVPHNTIIGSDYRVYHNDVGYDDLLIRTKIEEAIDGFSDDISPPEIISFFDNINSVGNNLNLILNVRDNSYLSSVTGYYDIGNGEQEINLELTGNTRFNYTYLGIIPASQEVLEGTIYFEITDAAGNDMTSDPYPVSWVEGLIPWQLQFSHTYDMNHLIGPATGAEFTGDTFYVCHYQDSYFTSYNSEGNFISDHFVSGIFDPRDLAWDGEYLYTGKASSEIWQIDPESFDLVQTIISQDGLYRAIAYDEDNDGFWGNNYEGDIVCSARDGSTIDIIEDPGPMHIYGLAYDNVTSGGPYLWCFDQGDGFSTPQNIRQLDIASEQFTGIEFDVSSRLGAGVAKGLFITDEYEEGVLTIGGLYILGNGYYDDYMIFGLTLGEATVDSPEIEMPEFESILSNYPNPFNPSTTISFTLNTEITEELGLYIYNIKGQKVKDLSPSLFHAEPVEVRGERKYSIYWNGIDDNNQPVPSGIYFYKLSSGDYSQTQKMMLLK
ncbi:hypothetical protein ACFLYK_04525 [Candidatus Cloacimonadota bacterium]